MRHFKSILFILIALLIGAVIYILFRPPVRFLAAFATQEHALVCLAWLPTSVRIFILYHLAGVLWALALAETVYVIKGSYKLGILIAFTSTVLFETMQYFNVLMGTGDIWDVLFVAFSLAGYWGIKRRIGVRNEEKN